MWFGCMDASCSEVFSTLTLPGGILTYRNFGKYVLNTIRIPYCTIFPNLRFVKFIPDIDPSAKAAIAQALTQNIASE